jgi:hypothetical protein
MKIKLIDDWKSSQTFLLTEYPLPKLPRENFILIFLIFLGALIGGLLMALIGLLVLIFIPTQVGEGLFVAKSAFLLWSKPAKFPRIANIFYKRSQFMESARCFVEVYRFPYKLRLEPKYELAYKLINDEKAIAVIPDQLQNILKNLLFVNMWLELYFGQNNYAPDNINKYNTELSKIASEREDFLNLITVIEKYLASFNNNPDVAEIRSHLIKILSDYPKCVDILNKFSLMK